MLYSSYTTFLLFGIVSPLIWTWFFPHERKLLRDWLLHLWVVMRPILGWFFIILGILGVILPILQGIIFLVLGAALIGRRHPLVRWVRGRYKLLIRRMSRSQQPQIRWIGRKSRMALDKLNRQMRDFQQRGQERRFVRRRFRLALVPPTEVIDHLNHWRRRYDPAFQHHLPPHIVLIATSHSVQRREFDRAVRAVAHTFKPFFITLKTVLENNADQRIVAPVEHGANAIIQLRDALNPETYGLRVSQRPNWPCLTLAKLRSSRSLHDAWQTIATEWQPVTWEASELVVFEERWGYRWQPVRRYRFGVSSRSTGASLLTAEELT